MHDPAAIKRKAARIVCRFLQMIEIQNKNKKGENGLVRVGFLVLIQRGLPGVRSISIRPVVPATRAQRELGAGLAVAETKAVLGTSALADAHHAPSPSPTTAQSALFSRCPDRPETKQQAAKAGKRPSPAAGHSPTLSLLGPLRLQRRSSHLHPAPQPAPAVPYTFHFSHRHRMSGTPPSRPPLSKVHSTAVVIARAMPRDTASPP